MIHDWWRRSPLRRRLQVTVAAVLALTVIIADAVLLGAAGRSIQREVDATVRATDRSLVVALDMLPALDAAAQREALTRLHGAWAETRHVCLDLEGPGLRLPPCQLAGPRAGVPDWFLARVDFEVQSYQYRFDSVGELFHLRLHPVIADEAREVWEETSTLMIALVLMALAMYIVLSWLIGRAIRPLEHAATTLDQIRQGNTVADPAPLMDDDTAAPPEFRSLSHGIRAFAGQLREGRTLARDLTRRALDAQEDERRTLARELHDELGQQLAAIEFEAAALQANAGPPVDAGLGRIIAAVRQTHQISRRVLRRLRPEALETLGLAGSLHGLAEDWRTRAPDWRLHCEIDPACDRLPKRRAIHLFRIAQEALSNTARHARATEVRMTLVEKADGLAFTLDDDGIGTGVSRASRGLGLLGIGERVEALGGHWALIDLPSGGTRLFVALPHSGNESGM